ncbi:MAG: hypothetical protein KIT31_34895, partial [Deltaproteobacteria bacterium]|nr:hypothetical protein [Deltaproteobacteria bacterium]
AIFGAGWGLAGYCPGPALVSLTSPSALVFAAAMVAGIVAARLARRACNNMRQDKRAHVR